MQNISLSVCWFGYDKKSTERKEDATNRSLLNIAVESNALIVLTCKRGLRCWSTTRSCVYIERKRLCNLHIRFEEVQTLVRMVSKEVGIEVKEINLIITGQWGPKFICSMMYVGEIVHIEGELGS